MTERDNARFTTADNVRFTYAYPTPTRDVVPLLASYHLLGGPADERLPARVTPTGTTSFFEDWEVTRAAFVARMASSIRHLGHLAPSGRCWTAWPCRARWSTT